MSKESECMTEKADGVQRGSTTNMVIQVGLLKLTMLCGTPMQGQQNRYRGAGRLQGL